MLRASVDESRPTSPAPVYPDEDGLLDLDALIEVLELELSADR